VIEPVTAWGVRIGVSDKDAKGRLSLGETELVFDLATEEGTLRIPLENITKVKRLRGSPVLVVDSREGEKVARFAFFFVKPPPLRRETHERRGKVRRRAVTYLQTTNASHKEALKAWETAVQEATARSS
jgi:hypothetical protein